MKRSAYGWRGWISGTRTCAGSWSRRWRRPDDRSTIPEILATATELPQSSAYRNMTALIEVGVVRRVAGADDHGRFELAEELSGHHHHLVCETCGKVEDVHPSPKLERALGEAARAVAEEQGYQVTEHQLDLLGLCPACRAT